MISNRATFLVRFTWWCVFGWLVGGGLNNSEIIYSVRDAKIYNSDRLDLCRTPPIAVFFQERNRFVLIRSHWFPWQIWLLTYPGYPFLQVNGMAWDPNNFVIAHAPINFEVNPRCKIWRFVVRKIGFLIVIIGNLIKHLRNKDFVDKQQVRRAKGIDKCVHGLIFVVFSLHANDENGTCTF